MNSNTMTVSFPGGKKVDASYNGFVIKTDQDVESGGEGSSPEPFDHFLASIATCTGIYVLGFCQKRDIPTDGISLTQSWKFEEKTRRLTDVQIAIEVPAVFPEKYRAALVRVANQCKVKKTMEDPPKFQIETVTV